MSEQAMEAQARARAVWSAGNWDEVSKLLPPAGRRVLDLAGVKAGMDVVDVGCGSGGTVAIPAALLGASVVGVDVTPELFDDAVRREAEAGVQVAWVEGAAASLPLPDDSVDRVLSTFGHAFEPDHAGAAEELVRVCRPGGVIAAAMWTPEGIQGRMFATVGRHMPAPPAGFEPPVLWGTEEHWHELVGSRGVALEFHRETLVLEAEDPDAYQAEFERNFGPLVVARRLLGDRFDALHADLAALMADANTATDGSIRAELEYLIAVGRVPG